MEEIASDANFDYNGRYESKLIVWVNRNHQRNYREPVFKNHYY